jgi:hypothetical protein
MDKSGYDAFLYDEKLYDAPTLSNEYCLVDYTENLRYKYTKQFVKVGLESLQLPTTEEVLTGNCKVKSYYNGEESDIIDFTITNNLISLYRPIRQYEKIIVTNTVRNIRTGYVFVGHPFMESDNFDDSNMRKFVSVDTNSFDIHVHFLSASQKKDGPSAGVSIAVAMISLFEKRLVDGDVAFTGEMTLKGEILPVGGVKEKLIACANEGIKTVFIPRANEMDLIDIPENVFDLVSIKLVSDFTEIYDALFR